MSSNSVTSTPVKKCSTSSSSSPMLLPPNLGFWRSIRTSFEKMVGGVCYTSVLFSKMSSLTCSLSPSISFCTSSTCSIASCCSFSEVSSAPLRLELSCFLLTSAAAPKWCCFQGWARGGERVGERREGEGAERRLPFTPHARALAGARSVRPPPSGALSLNTLSLPRARERCLRGLTTKERLGRRAGLARVPTFGGESVAASGGPAARLSHSGSALQLDAPSPRADSSTSSSLRGQNYNSYCFLNFYLFFN